MTVQTYSKEYVDGLLAVVEAAQLTVQHIPFCDDHGLATALAALDQTKHEPGCALCDDPLAWMDKWDGKCPRCSRLLPTADSKQRSFVVRSRQSVDPDELDKQRQGDITGQCEHPRRYCEVCIAAEQGVKE